MALQSAYAYMAMVGSNGNYYVRTQLFKWFVGAGSWWKTEGGSKHSVEVQYDGKDQKAGLFGQPLFMRYGLKSKIGSIDYQAMVLMGQTLTWKDKYDFKVNDQLKLSFTQVCDV